MNLGDGRLAVGIEQLGARADDAAVLLLRAGHVTGHVDEGDDRNVEPVAEADEAGGFVAGVDVEHAGQHRWLVGDDPDAVPAEARKADDDVRRELRVDLEEMAIVDDPTDHVLHVVGPVGVVGDDGVEFGVGAQRIVLRGDEGRVFHVVLGQVAEHLADQQQASCVSFSPTTWQTPLLLAWIVDPPSSSKLTSSCVTGLTTSGPVMNM